MDDWRAGRFDSDQAWVGASGLSLILVATTSRAGAPLAETCWHTAVIGTVGLDSSVMSSSEGRLSGKGVTNRKKVHF